MAGDATAGAAGAIGRTERATDTLTPRQAQLMMQLTLDPPVTLEKGDPLPPFWHYLHFSPRIRASGLGPDGHEKLGRFIPDFGLPLRMWAGGRVEIDKPLRLGETVEKVSRIRPIEEKAGRSGRLCFVTLDHDFSVDGAHHLRETQNVVYREPPAPGAPPPPPKPAPEGATFRRKVTPDPVLLFRYSAPIFYGHRSHYDADYTRDVEGYPGLVVHGPPTATLLVGLGSSGWAAAGCAASTSVPCRRISWPRPSPWKGAGPRPASACGHAAPTTPAR